LSGPAPQRHYLGKSFGALSGISWTRKPRRTLRPGDVLVTEITYTIRNGERFSLPAATRTRIRGNQATHLIPMGPSQVTVAS
jgi:hypothetical protein